MPQRRFCCSMVNPPGPSPQLAPRVLLLLFLMLLLQPLFIAASSSSSSTLNPYDTLGVPKTADQSTIRSHYKKLCLKYHPDKNIDRPESERKRCEEAFKKIQRANEMIGDEEARKQYDRIAAYGGSGAGYPFGRSRSGSGTSSYGGARTADDIYRAFYGGRGSGGNPYGGGAYGRRTRRAFYVNGVDVSDFFRFPAANVPFFGHPSTASAGDELPKSIYVEKVTIALEDLYAGVDNKILQVHDTVWARYRAAFRGGAAGRVALQALISSIPLLLRTSLPVAAFAFAICFHLGLPRPARLIFPTAILKGWKGGTKIKYSSNPEIGLCDIVFIVQEGKHERFARDGNDLRTSIAVGEHEARRGCTIHIEPIQGSTELPISVDLRPGEVEGGGYVKRIKGLGWPGRKGRGDLLVDIRLIPDDDGGTEQQSSKEPRSKNMDGDGARIRRRKRQRRRPNR